MRARGVIVLAVLLSGCLLEPQTLDSPCLGQPATDGGRCPACAADADCRILTNPCQPSASCLPRSENWAVTLEGCDVQHPPTTAECGCVDSVCQAK